jgi:DNA-binding CsgD family transcriptional regulator/tetratricopeptide (TPR) repeat protein
VDIAMRGREREAQIAADFLRDVEQGGGRVLLIEGEPGVGKSELLGQVINQASSRHFSLADASADELGQEMPLAPLLAALQEPIGASADEASGLGARETWTSAVGRIGAVLRQRAATAPVLVSLDDLQYADRATLFALRLLPRRLAAFPVAWNLAWCTSRPHGGARVLFDLLVGRGAARLTLNPLDDAAVAGLIADILGAEPGPGLVALASGAAGNPLLLTELVRGLQDEGAIQVTRGAASVVSPRLPQRLRAAARHWLGRLSRGVGYMLETAAVVGRAFRLDDVAEMLGRKPALILPLAKEAVAAGLLLAGTDSFTFRHELIWRAITEDLPPSARQALHRQFGGILLARGGAAARAAAHLLEGARQADRAVTARLDTAAGELLRSHPQAAADLAVRALDFTPAADANRVSRTVRAAGALTAAARLDEATAIVRTELAQPQPSPGGAQLRCTLSSILCLEGRATEANAEAETALAEPRLMAELRDEALIVQLQALSAQGENSRAYSLAESILTAFGEHGEPALAAALSVLAAVNWDDGRVDRGLRLARDAARRADRVSPDARHFQPLFVYAAMLVDLRRLERADVVIHAAREIIQALSPNVSEAIPAILGARVNLARGRTDDARVKAETALAIAETFGASPHRYLAHSVLSVIALRSGNLRTAGLHIRNRPDVTHYTTVYASAESLLARAQFVEAAVGPDSAMRVLGGTYAALPVHRRVLIGEPTASAWLARTALAAGRPALATGVARVADELARDNPGFDAVSVAAAHCGGIVGRDPDRLADAAARHPDPWARASAAEDLGTMLAAMNDRDAAVARLDAAFAGYGEVSADRDLARVRSRLRRLGVRRQHRIPAGRPAVGWASLTETERVVAGLVAQGLTNQHVAEQMYVSAHTVGFHLKQVFRKLGIGSRVELARLVAEQPPSQEPERQRGRDQDRG